MNKTNILVTGVAGNIGLCLTKSLLDIESINVIGVDNFITGTIKNIESIKSKNFKFINADVNNYEDISTVMLSNKIDYVFHYAALVGVQRTLQNPILVLKDLEGIKNLLNLSKLIGVKRVFYSSSSEVYGECTSFPQNEFSTPLNSRLPYAIVKNTCESYLRSYKQTFNLDYTIFRFFNTYGPYQSKDFVIPKFIDCALKNQDLNIFGDGLQTRTFLFINDNIEVTIRCLINDLMVNDVINIGSSHEITIKELAQTIINLTGSKSKINFIKALPDGDMLRRQPDNLKMMNILERPLISLQEGLLQTIKWIYQKY